MSLMNLVKSFSRLAVSSSVTQSTSLTHTQHVNIINLVSFRWFSTSLLKFRNLDSHAQPPYMLPSSKNKRWVERKPLHELYEYTVRPLPNPKTGGRGPNGRIWNHRRGGGHKRNYRMIDWVRSNGMEDGKTMIEKIDGVLYDPNRSARIALVAQGERKRYIIATHNMKPGMLVRSSLQLTRSPVRPIDGDSYPLGSLPVGTLVNCVEKFPGAGGQLARSAGVTALLMRKQDETVTVRLPSKREIVVSSKCTATVGRVSNVDHNKRVIGKAGRNRWLGIRPHSGRWHRKTGRSGRKIRAIKPANVYDKVVASKPKPIRFTMGGTPGVSLKFKF